MAAEHFFFVASGPPTEIGRQDFGEDRARTMFRPSDLEPSGNEVTPRLYPAALQLEPVGGHQEGGVFYSTIAGVANKISQWRRADRYNWTGDIEEIYVDHIEGAKAVVHLPDQVIFAGYYVNRDHA